MARKKNDGFRRVMKVLIGGRSVRTTNADIYE
jgi:hypothetical protein